MGADQRGEGTSRMSSVKAHSPAFALLPTPPLGGAKQGRRRRNTLLEKITVVALVVLLAGVLGVARDQGSRGK